MNRDNTAPANGNKILPVVDRRGNLLHGWLTTAAPEEWLQFTETIEVPANVRGEYELNGKLYEIGNAVAIEQLPPT